MPAPPFMRPGRTWPSSTPARNSLTPWPDSSSTVACDTSCRKVPNQDTMAYSHDRCQRPASRSSARRSRSTPTVCRRHRTQTTAGATAAAAKGSQAVTPRTQAAGAPSLHDLQVRRHARVVVAAPVVRPEGRAENEVDGAVLLEQLEVRVGRVGVRARVAVQRALEGAVDGHHLELEDGVAVA